MLDVRKLLRPNAQGAAGDENFDFSSCDFDGFTVAGPVALHWQAAPSGRDVKVELDITATLSAECARCLAPASQPLHIQKDYRISEEDLRDDFPQLPLSPAGLLDLQEMTYGEIVIESPPAILCREDCEGLCGRCGAAQSECRCQAEPEGDPRLQVLRTLLNTDDD